MKTFFLFRNVSLFFSVFIFSVLLLFCIRCTPPPAETDDSYKKKLITHEEAQVLFDEYTNTNNRILTESRNGEPDSRWYSFSIEEMEGYIKYVKEQAEEKNLQNVRIKIYMGKYPVNHPANKMAKPEFAGYQTIFLMPTAKREESQRMRRGTSDETENIQSIQPMNMTNLSPPPNHVSANSLNGN